MEVIKEVEKRVTVEVRDKERQNSLLGYNHKETEKVILQYFPMLEREEADDWLNVTTNWEQTPGSCRKGCNMY